ncbi:MAG: ISL3 family transposase [Candidatus Methanoplasma sp.]|jgi:transposase|nr:ISL3 family transposase [Candidatus Methanoplasma sp.]
MEDAELAEFMLGIREPWKVTEIWHVTETENEIHIRADVPMGSSVPCPCCGKMCRVHDRPNGRIWRDLDAWSWKTYIHARIPRSDCPEHGVKQIDIPWARPNSRFTLMMESFIMALAEEMAVGTAARKIDEYSGRVWTAVRAKAEELLSGLNLSGTSRVSVDEKSFSGRDFITVFADTDTRKIIFCTAGKDSETVRKFKEFLKEHGGDHLNITDFSCDFGSAFISGIRRHFRNAKITCDRFHLVKLANEALADTNCGVLKLTVSRMKAKYLMLRNDGNMSEKDRERRDMICRDNEVLGIAYRLKESLCSVYLPGDVYSAEQHLKEWIRWAGMTKLRQFVRLAETVRENMPYILQWFPSKLTNGMMEGINSLISVIKSRARGFHYPENLISMCYLVSNRNRGGFHRNYARVS